MADWFKLHENWFHEPRLQWAIKEQVLVVPCWLWVLTECCRTKSDTIGLHSEDYEMLGIQQLLNISPGVFNLSIKLLEKIKYIQIDPLLKTIKVIRWNEIQSDYCQKKTKFQNQEGDLNQKRTKKDSSTKSDTVRHSLTKSDSIHQEERRGDKIRKEEEEDPFEIKYQGPSSDPEPFLVAWNASQVFPKCMAFTDKRKKALHVRMRDGFFSNNWQMALAKIKSSSFCTGKNDRGWKPDIDWFLKPDSVPKIMEGKYDDKTGKYEKPPIVLRKSNEEIELEARQSQEKEVV